METPITFKNEAGNVLFGIMHEPAAGTAVRGIAIILLSPGVKMRVAPHRMYNVMAEHYARMGFHVLRFDFHGLGDSEGEMPYQFLAELYGNVQVGCYVNDTHASMRWVQSNYGISRFILGGLCGGAISGLLAAQNDERVVGLLGIGIPVVLDSQNVDWSKYLSKGQSERLRKGYLKKLLSPKAWFRLLSFRSDYTVILRIFSQLFGAGKMGQKAEATEQDGVEADNFNHCFPPAFSSLIEAGKKIIFIFSGADRLHWEYEEKFVQRYKDKIPVSDSIFSVHVIENANHILSSDGSMDEMLRLTKEWLSEGYSAG